jgi:hypothetical protein
MFTGVRLQCAASIQRPLSDSPDPHPEPALVADEHHLDDLVICERDLGPEGLTILLPPMDRIRRGFEK